MFYQVGICLLECSLFSCSFGFLFHKHQIRISGTKHLGKNNILMHALIGIIVSIIAYILPFVYIAVLFILSTCL